MQRATYVPKMQQPLPYRYDGGAGIDTFTIKLTAQQWQLPAVKAEMARLAHFFATQRLDPDGEGHGTFTGRYFNLQIANYEKLRIIVGDKLLFPIADARNDLISVKASGVNTAGAPTKTTATGNVMKNDLASPDMVASIVKGLKPGEGSLTLKKDGSFTYTTDAAFAALGVGQTKTVVATYKISSPLGQTDTATLTIKIVGVNDGVRIVSAESVTTGTIVEKVQSGEGGGEGEIMPLSTALPSVNGHITFTDADIRDAHTVTQGAAVISTTGYPLADVPAGGFGFLIVYLIENTGDANPKGRVDWHFAVQDILLDSLAEGETVTQRYPITIRDAHGASVVQNVVITLRGTNDRPTVEGVVSAKFNEDDAGPVMVDLLARADDVDHGHDLGIAQNSLSHYVMTENWDAPITYQVNEDTGQLSIDPAQFDALGFGETLRIGFDYLVVDEHGAGVWASAVVEVKGSNDAPTITTVGHDAAESAIEVAENSTGTFLTVAASDPDRNAQLTFSIGNNPDGSFDNSFFTVDPTTGEVSFAAPPDYEYADVGGDHLYKVRVTVTDEHGASGHGDYFVRVTDVNEAPEFVSDTYSFSFAENNEPGSIVGGVAAADPDSADTLRFAITAGNDDGWFAIDELTGAITTTRSFDFETDPASYSLTVSVRDRISGGLTDTATVAISLADLSGVVTETIVATTTRLWSSGYGWGGTAYDASTGAFYFHDGYGQGFSNGPGMVSRYVDASAFEANAFQSQVDLDGDLAGTYFGAAGSQLIGRALNSSSGPNNFPDTTKISSWNDSTGSLDSTGPSLSGISGDNNEGAFNWGGFSAVNVVQDQTGTYVVGHQGDSWQVGKLDLGSFQFTSTQSFTHGTFGWVFAVDGVFFFGDSYNSEHVSIALDYETGDLIDVDITLAMAGSDYVQDTTYDSATDTLYVINNGSLFKLGNISDLLFA